MSTLTELYTSVCARLVLYYAAEAAVLKGQAYSIGNRTLTRPDLDAIRKAITDLIADKLQLERGNKVRVQRVVPRDI